MVSPTLLTTFAFPVEPEDDNAVGGGVNVGSISSIPARRDGAERTIETRCPELPRLSHRTTLPARRLRPNKVLLGEVSERLTELVSKTSVWFFPNRGFESSPFRFLWFILVIHCRDREGADPKGHEETGVGIKQQEASGVRQH